MWSARSPNFASSVRASTRDRPVAPSARRRAELRTRVNVAFLADRTDHRPPSDHAAPIDETRPVDDEPEQRRLPGAVRAGDRQPLARSEVDDRQGRDETCPRSATAPASRNTTSDGRVGRRKRQVELPGLERLRTAARFARGAVPPDAPSSAARGWRGDPGRRSCRPGQRPCLVPRFAACSGAA